MDTTRPTALLGGLSPDRFMRRHWQRRPLLVRQAVPDVRSPLSRAALFDLAAQEGVASRLLAVDAQGWRLRRGPIPRRALPTLSRPGWTLLVQGVDGHDDAAHALLSLFRFVPDARLDDLMISWASDGGGVGPHVDSYDVFLLQLEGRRRWRVAPPGDARIRAGLPLRILQHFEPTEDWLLEPGDMLYLPPGWGHDGVAVGPCLTASIGFRAPTRLALANDVMQAVLDGTDDEDRSPLYGDAGAEASRSPGAIPPRLQAYARDAVRRLVTDDRALDCALGEVLSQPRPGVVFDAAAADTLAVALALGLRLDRRTRMLHDAGGIYINGESYRASGRDARLMRALADERRLGAADLRRLGEDARELVAEWLDAGWAHPSTQV